ncbi:hypothetical protein ANTQUA_LOCUS2075 [Anthophora quadrimaculata]
MKLWMKIILEWLNCLDVLEININNLKELDDGKLYKKLIELFSWKGIGNVLNTENIVTKFLQDEYPKYKFDYKNLDEMEHMYITSLFLLYASQEPLFHRPMCSKLQHETQLQIKAFLEMSIPYGKNVNRETLQEIITELQNDAQKTPITPKTKTLKDFFNSPAVQSAQRHKVLNDTYRELRKLRTELEVERFEKAELQEDLLIQQKKVQNLQKKLLEKTAEIKTLQQEKLEPNSPQSCKETKDTTDSEQYKREIHRLENELMEKQYEIVKHEENNDILIKKITCMKVQCTYFREKLESCEKSLENMQIQGEIKDRELINLRTTNDELRVYLKELNKTVLEDQSFEIDGIVPLNSSSSLNSSEVLSSVVEIQLKEAKEESDMLKTQLDALNQKLESTNEEHKDMIESLNKKIQTLEDTKVKLNVTLNELNKKVESLEEKNESLMDRNKNLEELYICEKESLSQAEESKNVLSTEISILNEKIKDLQKSLHNENVNTDKLNVELRKVNSQVHENLKRIEDLTNQNNLYKASLDLSNSTLKEIISHHSEINYTEDNLNSKTTIQLILHLKTILNNFNKKYISKQMEFESLNDVTKQVNSKVEDLQLQVSKLTKKDEQSTMDILKLKETIAQNETEITKLTTTIERYSKKISHLKEVEFQKLTLEKDLDVHKEEINKKNILLQDSTKCIQDLRKQMQDFTREFYLVKKDILNQINEYQKHSKDINQSISNAHKVLYATYTEEQLYRNKLEDELADNKKNLKDSQNLNITLENDITKHKQIINNLQRELINTNEKLTKSIEKLEKCEEVKDKLEKQHKDLEYENTKILLDLNNINDKFKESQQEVCNMSNHLKFKDEKIGNLIAEITSLKLEKEHIIHLQKGGESKTKNFINELETKLLQKQRQLDQLSIEVKLKEETLELVQDKFCKLSKETLTSEMKLKEVIENLQIVRTNQDAVLATQERALQEKCLQLKQLQKEFNNSKEALCKKLDNEELCKNLQSTNSELQIQLYKQTKTIEELQEMLKEEKNELVKIKEYCKSKDMKKLEMAQICEKLEYSINDLKATIIEVSPNDENFYADITYDISHINDDDKIENILKIVRTSINEIHASRKLILHLFTVNTNLNKTLQNQTVIVDNYVTKCEEIKLLKTKIQELNDLEKARTKYVNSLVKRKELLNDCLQNIIKSRADLDISLNESKQKWDKLLAKSGSIFIMDKCVCEELKCVQAKKTHLENALFKHYISHFENIKPVQNILWEQFLWSEQKLKNNCSETANNEQVLHILSDSFSKEETIIATELHKNAMLQKDIVQLQNQMDNFSDLVTSFEIDYINKTVIKSELEKELQLNIDALTENKNDLESKLNCARIKNEKLENDIDELKIKMQKIEEASLKKAENLKKQLIQLEEENFKLQKERNELSKRPKKEDVNNQLKDINDKYKLKLDEIKQTMKTAYNEQITKQNKEQEQRVQEDLESLQKKMELQYRKQTDELSKYKAHVANMSSQLWNVGEKLLSAQQEKEKLQKELTELKAKYKNVDQKMVSPTEHKSSKYEKRELLRVNKEEILHKVAVIQEETTYERRCSIRSIQTMGNAFNAEDEEGEVFDNIYLADMKDGNSLCNIDPDRISILKKRNALCKPHLKSSYPAEMQFHPQPFTEEEIKTGSVSDEIFNDSLSQSLLPEQKAKKKDRTQTSYKKPGPPTPSKNGGRLSLQGGELRSPNSRILRERNKDRTSATPRKIKNLFMSKRQDENVVVSPRGRKRSSIFRIHRGTNDR